MKTNLLVLSALLLGACAPLSPRDTIELVESAPVESTLAHGDLRATHDVWLEVIEGAHERLDLAFFYASDQAPSRLTPLVAAVVRAADRGVHVRLLTDAGFYETYPAIPDELGRHTGIDVRLFDMEAATGGGVLHAKYLLVDDEEAFIGSANFDWRSLEHIQELGVLVNSARIATALRDIFEIDWALAGGEARPAPRDVTRAELAYGPDSVRVRPVFSPPGQLADASSHDLPVLLEWIAAAEECVRVQLLSYSRYDVLDDALRAAAKRGVRVELLVADWNKRPYSLADLKSLQCLAGVEVRFVTVPQASSGFVPYARVIHAKYMVVDGKRAWLGTSNWSRGYFEESRNVGLLIEGRSFAERLERFFASGWDCDYAETVDPDAEYAVPRIGE